MEDGSNLKDKITSADTCGSSNLNRVCVHACKEAQNLPVKTLAAHRACISTMGMIGPFVWKRPMTASVGRNREGGNSLLKFDLKRW